MVTINPTTHSQVSAANGRTVPATAGPPRAGEAFRDTLGGIGGDSAIVFLPPVDSEIGADGEPIRAKRLRNLPPEDATLTRIGPPADIPPFNVLPPEDSEIGADGEPIRAKRLRNLPPEDATLTRIGPPADMPPLNVQPPAQGIPPILTGFADPIADSVDNSN